MPLRAILFDHDGTLVDSEPVHYRIWAGILGRYGIALSEALYRDHYAGVPTRTNAVDLVRRFAMDVEPQVLAEAKIATTRTYLEQSAFPLMPGVHEAVGAFREAGLRLAVVTGANASGVAATLRAHGLAGYFTTVVSADDVRAGKPAPDCYLLAMARLGLTAAECIAIEDTGHGLAAAAGAGIRCLAVPTPMSVHHDVARSTAVVEGMAGVMAYVRRMLMQPGD